MCVVSYRQGPDLVGGNPININISININIIHSHKKVPDFFRPVYR